MNGLVEELLLLARLDEGRPLERHAVDLAELLVEAIGTARAVAPDRPIALKVAEVVEVTGDRDRLRQVIDNLLANVRAHTPAGTRTTIELRAERGSAVLRVSDEGPGMTTEQAARAFERFFRGDPSRTRSTGGTGLGLSIVEALVNAHQGSVQLASTTGAGVTVTVTLPGATTRSTNPEPNSSGPAQSVASTSRPSSTW